MNQEEKDNTVLLFLDFETTGVDTYSDFPIEIGCIATDITLEKIFFRYEALIKFPRLVDHKQGKEKKWKEEYSSGFPFHKIDPTFWHFNSKEVGQVMLDIENLLVKNTGKRGHWILTSDNIQFEYQFMQKIYKDVYPLSWKEAWPFHYCGWDTSLLLEASGVGDPRNTPHRALADTELLLEATQEAMRILKRNKPQEKELFTTYPRVRSILERLVELKKHKIINGKDEYYLKEKEKLWNLAAETLEETKE